ncbi:hypothetical protein DFJ74DRAFT_682098 [Hyaloraphidium curvatum]|nr:hypothetical protein DFJ74DRAFT_682098 [Hyaloraphidium curvatum]
MSLLPPFSLTTAPAPAVGSPAPPSVPRPSVTIVLRHPGCPFAEATLQDLAALFRSNPPPKDVATRVVLHGDEGIAKSWLKEATAGEHAVPEGVEVLVDGPELAIRKELGIGWTSLVHFLGPGSLGGVFKLRKERGVANRFPETGNRWLTAAVVAVDRFGKVTYVHLPSTAAELPDLAKAYESVRRDSNL